MSKCLKQTLDINLSDSLSLSLGLVSGSVSLDLSLNPLLFPFQMTNATMFWRATPSKKGWPYCVIQCQRWCCRTLGDVWIYHLNFKVSPWPSMTAYVPHQLDDARCFMCFWWFIYFSSKKNIYAECCAQLSWEPWPIHDVVGICVCGRARGKGGAANDCLGSKGAAKRYCTNVCNTWTMEPIKHMCFLSSPTYGAKQPTKQNWPGSMAVHPDKSNIWQSEKKRKETKPSETRSDKIRLEKAKCAFYKNWTCQKHNWLSVFPFLVPKQTARKLQVPHRCLHLASCKERWAGNQTLASVATTALTPFSSNAATKARTTTSYAWHSYHHYSLWVWYQQYSIRRRRNFPKTG